MRVACHILYIVCIGITARGLGGSSTVKSTRGHGCIVVNLVLGRSVTRLIYRAEGVPTRRSGKCGVRGVGTPRGRTGVLDLIVAYSARVGCRILNGFVGIATVRNGSTA